MRYGDWTRAMPELPEVETTRRGLEDELLGSTVEAVQVLHPRVLRRQLRPADFADRLTHRKVARLGRHGKFLMFELDTGLVWVTHLGMSGRLRISEPSEPVETHARVVLDLDSGRQLRFIDTRTFGFMVVFTPDELDASSLRRLGPDAHDELPGSRTLAEALHGRVAPIKALLLDQGIVAGVGNIYADETLHRARVAPERRGGDLSFAEVRALRSAIKATLDAGLRWGGTSLDDLAYLLPDGRAGRYLRRLRVYGREGEPCRRCGSEIRRTVIRSRSSYWCAGCQS